MAARNPTPIGEKFNLLTIIADLPSHPHHGRIVEVKCDCGESSRILLARVVSGKTKSCGCLRITNTCKTHGYGRTNDKAKKRTYNCWLNMNKRCTDETLPSWKHYGARGITVCDRWGSFENFLADMGDCPEGLSIDRIDVNLGYSKGNCRWATDVEQMNNTTRNRVLTFKGQSLTVAEWSRETGLSANILYMRLNVMKWTVERTLTEPRRNYPMHRI